MSLLFSFQLFVSSTYLLSLPLPSPSYARTQELIRWLSFRQATGFQGRANKPVDCCYSFWVGASLKLLHVFQLAQFHSNVQFTLSCQVKLLTDSWPIYAGLAFCSVCYAVLLLFTLSPYFVLTHRHCRIRLLVDSRNGQIVILTPYTLV